MSKFNSKQYVVKTPNIITVGLSLLLVFIPFIIIWVLVGEFNVLKNNWIIPFKGNNQFMFNPMIFVPMFIVLVLSIGVIVILYYCKLVNFDTLPFITMFNAMGFSTILSGLIPYNQNILTYIVISRFLIVIVVSLITFFIFNKITNSYLMDSSNSYLLYREFKKEIIEDSIERKKMKDFIGKNKEDNFIEVDKKDL